MTEEKKVSPKKKAATKTSKSPKAKKTQEKTPTKKKSTPKKTTASKKTSKVGTKKKTAPKKAPAKKTPTKKAATKKVATKKTKASDEKKTADKPKRTRKKGKALVVVESPAKAKTIEKYLGKGYTVKASVGHVKDLPKSKMGVAIEDRFEPEYEVIRDKQKVIDELKKHAGRVEEVYLAPDPDREGEAIAWHIAEELKEINPNIKRILINEITKNGVTAAMENPTEVNMSKTDAQQARRILDRLVGYQISPLLWKKVRRGLSAGRVQSVAVRLLVERELEIAKFVPEEYWSVEADCAVETPPPFLGKVVKFSGEKASPKTEKDAKTIVDELTSNEASITKVVRKQRRRKAQPPFITSKLQQEAARKLRFSAKRTMALAQRLYEGLELGEEGPVGLITYMRTDSTRISDDAMAAVRGYITKEYGNDYLPKTPQEYGKKKRAQDAHEAIRPTNVEFTPEFVEQAIQGHPEVKELVRLYRLIWQRFVASQMKPAVYDQTSVDVTAGTAVLRATGQIMTFNGYTRVYESQETDDAVKEKAEKTDKLLPPLEEGQKVDLQAIRPEQHFTQPPPRFSEASLVKELEERGIGRPSTYASILSTIVARDYVEKKEARFWPTELGVLVNELLVDSFPKVLDIDFTAAMEGELDGVEDGDRDWRDVLGDFYKPFAKNLEHAKEHMRDVKREEIPTDHVCEKCKAPMIIRWGRNGSFLACSAYPECRNTKEILRHADGSFELVPEVKADRDCPACDAPMIMKRGRFGAFLACTKYPDCKTTLPIPIGVDCPKEDCDGYVTEKRSKRGRTFFGCSNYAKTNCDFVSWDRPINKKCPTCEAPYLLKRENRSGVVIKCNTCGYKATGEDEEQAA